MGPFLTLLIERERERGIIFYKSVELLILAVAASTIHVDSHNFEVAAKFASLGTIINTNNNNIRHEILRTTALANSCYFEVTKELEIKFFHFIHSPNATSRSRIMCFHFWTMERRTCMRYRTTLNWLGHVDRINESTRFEKVLWRKTCL